MGKIPTGRNIKVILSQAEWQQKNIGIGRHGLTRESVDEVQTCKVNREL